MVHQVRRSAIALLFAGLCFTGCASTETAAETGAAVPTATAATSDASCCESGEAKACCSDANPACCAEEKAKP